MTSKIHDRPWTWHFCAGGIVVDDAAGYMMCLILNDPGIGIGEARAIRTAKQIVKAVNKELSQ